MPRLEWDLDGERLYETGVDQGVLYIPTGGIYDEGYAWNGLTGVTESPSGAEPTALYADNRKYLNLLSTEEFGGTIEAYTFPDEFAQCDGTVVPTPGVSIGQQPRHIFGLCYRTRLGNDIDATDYGYKLHLVYGALAAPSEKAYATINDTPEAVTFSWAFTTTPVSVSGGGRPTSVLTIDSSLVDADVLADLEDILYGTDSLEPRLPLPDEVGGMFAVGDSRTPVTPLAPTINGSTGVITVPTVTGVVYRRADTNAIVTGTLAAIPTGTTLVIKAFPLNGSVYFTAGSDDDWSLTWTA